MNSATHCEICGMAFINQTQVKNHIDLAHVKSLFQCQSCNKVLKDETEFKHHMQFHFRLQKSQVRV
jgi:uncharacterized C2H2 Zn-finger protein